MLGTEDTSLHSPITPLSFDFDKKKRSKQQQLLKRCNSPDILNRSSHDLVLRTERMRASEENLRSSGYSEAEADYAPVSTERWIREDSQGDHFIIISSHRPLDLEFYHYHHHRPCWR